MTASSDYPPLSGGDIHIYLLHLEVSTKLEVIKDLSNLYFIDERIKGWICGYKDLTDLTFK